MTNCPYCGGEIPSKDFAVKSPKGDYWHMPCADAGLDELIALREANDKLSAQVAELREGLEEIQARCELRTMDDDAHYENYYEAKRLLSHPDPGAEIMGRMAKLEAVAEAAREVEKFIFPIKDENLVKVIGSDINKLVQALAALEAGEKT